MPDMRCWLRLEEGRGEWRWEEGLVLGRQRLMSSRLVAQAPTPVIRRCSGPSGCMANDWMRDGHCKPSRMSKSTT